MEWMYAPRLPHLPRLAHTLSGARLSFLHQNLDTLPSPNPLTATESHPPPPPPRHQPQDPPKLVGIDDDAARRRVEIAHPWTELMEVLFKKGYLDIAALDGPKNSNLIRTACLNFSRDRFDLIRYFSRRDIHVMVGAGCPSLDRKVVNSGKRLRAHVGINEGDVCSSCNLRGSCERAYVKAREDEGGRTIDLMRFLLTYGLDRITGSLENTESLTKLVKESVRKLMNEMVELSEKEFSFSTTEVSSGRYLSRPDNKSSGHQMQKSQINVLMKQGDWICPNCNFMNFAKNMKCLRCAGVCEERLDKLRKERENLPLKKGDWICEKCHFFNFAKNTRCLQCQEKPPKRHLNPGEWECVSCNYINFRKNMVCLKCDWKRPKASSNGDIAPQSHSKISFVRDSDDTRSHNFIQQNCSSDEEGSNFWSCEESETDEDENDDNENFRCNFPIIGGKSVISKDPFLREKWKGDMSKSRGVSSKGLKENVTEMDYLTPAGMELDESSDEDDVAGWFRKNKCS